MIFFGFIGLAVIVGVCTIADGHKKNQERIAQRNETIKLISSSPKYQSKFFKGQVQAHGAPADP